MKKRIVGYMVAVVLLIGLVTTAIAAPGLVNFQKSKTYDKGTFADVPDGAWYYENLKTTYQMGLIKGVSNNQFSPNGNVTIAEAITLASRIHSIYNDGKEGFAQGTPWYQVYVDCAKKAGIIYEGQFDSYTRAATRAEFVGILSKSMPSNELGIINSVEFSDIPDVSSGSAYSSGIIMFYRAGVLTGSDENRTFMPNSTVKRSEVVAIISRIIDAKQRVKLDIPSGSWQECYKKLLKDKNVFDDATYNSYIVYDIDKDGTPEILLHSGSGEADSLYDLYTYDKDNKLSVFLSSIKSSHAYFAGVADENGIVLVGQHMGLECVIRYYLFDGYLTREELFNDIRYEGGYFYNACNVYKTDDLSGLNWTNNQNCEENPAWIFEQVGYRNWKDAYSNLLIAAEISNKNDSYVIYDIDKDGAPELFIHGGGCEADYYYDVYTYDEGTYRYIMLGRIGAGHGALAGLADENGVLFAAGHQGVEQIWKYSIQKDQHIADGVFSREKIYGDATDMHKEYHKFNHCTVYNIYDIAGLEWTQNSGENHLPEDVKTVMLDREALMELIPTFVDAVNAQEWGTVKRYSTESVVRDLKKYNVSNMSVNFRTLSLVASYPSDDYFIVAEYDIDYNGSEHKDNYVIFEKISGQYFVTAFCDSLPKTNDLSDSGWTQNSGEDHPSEDITDAVYVVKAQLKDSVLSKDSCYDELGTANGRFLFNEFFVVFNTPLAHADVTITDKDGKRVDADCRIATEYDEDAVKNDIKSIRIQMRPETNQSYQISITNIVAKSGQRAQDYSYMIYTEKVDPYFTVDKGNYAILTENDTIKITGKGFDMGKGTLDYRIYCDNKLVYYGSFYGTTALEVSDIINIAQRCGVDLYGKKIILNLFMDNMLENKTEGFVSYTFNIR